MLVHIPNVLPPDQLAEIRRLLDKAQWVDGKGSASLEAAAAKHNLEVSAADPNIHLLREKVTTALMAAPRFVAMALPVKIVPPSFSRYNPGQTYGVHSDGGIFHFSANGTPMNVRSDLAATLFLNPPEDYDGGELTIQDTFGLTKVKLPAGDVVLYPASSQHYVAPVTRGQRQVSFFWVQSIVRYDEHRAHLDLLDTAIRELRAATPGSPTIGKLVSLYHNLLRTWAET